MASEDKEKKKILSLYRKPKQGDDLLISNLHYNMEYNGWRVLLSVISFQNEANFLSSVGNALLVEVNALLLYAITFETLGPLETILENALRIACAIENPELAKNYKIKDNFRQTALQKEDYTFDRIAFTYRHRSFVLKFDPYNIDDKDVMFVTLCDASDE